MSSVFEHMLQIEPSSVNKCVGLLQLASHLLRDLLCNKQPNMKYLVVPGRWPFFNGLVVDASTKDDNLCKWLREILTYNYATDCDMEKTGKQALRACASAFLKDKAVSHKLTGMFKEPKYAHEFVKRSINEGCC